MTDTAPNQQWMERSRAYWVRNNRLQLSLLAVWFVVGYVLPILLARPLHDVNFFSFPLSYWIAQNGSIFVFVALIFIYAWRMDLLDHDYDVHEEDVGIEVRKRFERRVAKKQGNGRG